MNLRLLSAFGVASLQGGPITGFRRFGVPVGGAFDQESLAIANVLVGNEPTSPAWELGMARATFQSSDDGVVAVVGAPTGVHYADEKLESNTAFSVKGNREWIVEPPTSGARVYVAWSALRRPLEWRVRLHEIPSSLTNRTHLRVIPGPQSDLFDRSYLDTPYLISRSSNRVGIRLEGSAGGHSIQLPSEPQCVGAIQVSNDGAPIVIGPDGPTIGGYPKIGVVISADIDRIGQLRPGDSVTFQLCNLEDALEYGRVAREDQTKKLTLLGLAL